MATESKASAQTVRRKKEQKKRLLCKSMPTVGGSAFGMLHQTGSCTFFHPVLKIHARHMVLFSWIASKRGEVE